MITCHRVQVKRGQDSRRYRWLGVGDGDTILELNIFVLPLYSAPRVLPVVN